MPETVRESLSLNDSRGQTKGILIIAGNAGELHRLGSKEADKYGEEPVQLEEGKSYDYKLESGEPGLRMRANGVLRQSMVAAGESETGNIRPGLNTGLLPLILEDSESNEVARAAVEVRSSKLTYREDYRYMLDFIADKATGLLMNVRAPAHARLSPDPKLGAETLHQRFAFLRALLASREFREAVSQVLASPHRDWREEDYERDVRRGGRLEGRNLRQLTHGTPRVPLPTGHPLHARMKTLGIAQPSVPARVTVSRSADTVDTPENRFVKYALSGFERHLTDMEASLRKRNRREDERLRSEIVPLREELTDILKRDFFNDISEPRMLPLGSSVLHRRGGYREILQAWLKFNLAARLVWDAGDEVYGGGKRDVAILYEYWTFFRLLDLVVTEFGIPRPLGSELIERTADKFDLKLKTGRELSLQGKYSCRSRQLCVRFSYNKTFSRTESDPAHDASQNYPAAGSWTRRMRPDYTLSFWPEEYTPDEAEQQELMVHIHFDAKYRVEKIVGLFGEDTDEELERDKEAQRNSTSSKRADLLKMHAYKDAIRRTEGAYVIYPGSGDADRQQWLEFHEILPGLGAFPVRPTAEQSDMEAVAEFLFEVTKHLCDRATRREQLSFHLYRIQHEADRPHVDDHLPERDPTVTGTRTMPPAEHYVLIAPYENRAQLDWVNRTGLYNLSIGSLQLGRLYPSLTQARHLLLYDRELQPTPGLWKTTALAPRLFTRTDLVDAGYTGTLGSDELWLVYDIAPDAEFEDREWSLQALINDSETTPSIPLTETLDKVLAAQCDV